MKITFGFWSYWLHYMHESLLSNSVKVSYFLLGNVCKELETKFKVEPDLTNGTVCPRSLDLYQRVTYCIKWVKASWKYSNGDRTKQIGIIFPLWTLFVSQSLMNVFFLPCIFQNNVYRTCFTKQKIFYNSCVLHQIRSFMVYTKAICQC